MEKLKKLLSLLLALAMVFSLAACGGEEEQEESYTYRYTGESISTWSPTDWSTASEGDLVSFTASALYDFAMNTTKDGYDVVPEGAAALPEDVTSEFAGNATYGVPEDATEGYAWRIKLNENMCWQDGTKITADDYLYSLQQFLSPEMKNYRASIFYEGSFNIANAKEYYSKGEMMYNYATQSVEYGTPFEEIEQDLYLNSSVVNEYWWEMSIDDVFAEYGNDYDAYFTLEDGTLLFDKYATGTDILVTEEVYNDLAYLCGEGFEDDWLYWCVTATPADGEWEDVGLIKEDDYTITFVLKNPTTEFYAVYALSTPMLVNQTLYEENKKDAGGLIKSSYGTSVDQFASYGPYKVVDFQPDRKVTLARNENWYGWTDGNHEGQYQTTNIEINMIDETSTIKQLFFQGELEVYGLQKDDMTQYGTSDYAYYSPQTYTWKYSFNTDYETLHAEDDEANGINHSILSLIEFRQAISLALDRSAFVAKTEPASEPGYGLINNLYVCDPETGERYRDSEWAQQAMRNFYGVEDTSKITGYDKEAAAAKFQEAYDKAIEQGILKETDTIELDLHAMSYEINQDRTDFLHDAIQEATVGTSLEGKVKVLFVADDNWTANAQSGLCDVTYTSWGGSDMDPYNIMQCYVYSDYANEYGLGDICASTDLTLNINGEDVTYTLTDWYYEMYSGSYATADTDVRNQILAGMEQAILETYTTIPVLYQNSACLYSQRLVLGSDTYVNSLVEFGGIRFMTYTMNDEEWKAYCEENNNQLTY